MRIRDWSSDVCSSDLARCSQSGTDFPSSSSSLLLAGSQPDENSQCHYGHDRRQGDKRHETQSFDDGVSPSLGSRCAPDRKSGVKGKSVSVRVDLGGRRIIKQTKIYYKTQKKSQ